MSKSQLDVYKKAAGRIVQTAPASLVATDKATTQCNLYYDETRRGILRRHAWNFAKKTTALVPYFIQPGMPGAPVLPPAADVNGYPSWALGAYVVSHDGVSTWSMTDGTDTYAVQGTDRVPPETGWSFTIEADPPTTIEVFDAGEPTTQGTYTRGTDILGSAAWYLYPGNDTTQPHFRKDGLWGLVDDFNDYYFSEDGADLNTPTNTGWTVGPSGFAPVPGLEFSERDPDVTYTTSIAFPSDNAEWCAAYRLPEDYIRVREILPSGSVTSVPVYGYDSLQYQTVSENGDTKTLFDIQGDVLYTVTGDAQVNYTFDQEDLTQWDDSAYEYLWTQLAYDTCMSITGKMALHRQIAEQLVVVRRQAPATNANEKHRRLNRSSSLVNSRLR